jgi:hypothetical protein
MPLRDCEEDERFLESLILFILNKPVFPASATACVAPVASEIAGIKTTITPVRA